MTKVYLRILAQRLLVNSGLFAISDQSDLKINQNIQHVNLKCQVY